MWRAFFEVKFVFLLLDFLYRIADFMEEAPRVPRKNKKARNEKGIFGRLNTKNNRISQSSHGVGSGLHLKKNL